jgi:hypothetical protein
MKHRTMLTSCHLLLQTRIADLPPAAHVVVALALALGLLLWVFGNRLLKPLFGLLTGLLGALAGLFLFPALLPSELLGALSPYIGLGVGGILGLALGILLFRFAIAIGMGSVAGVAAVLITGILLHSPEMNRMTAAARITLPQTPALREAEQLRRITREDLREAAAPVESRVRDFLREKSEELTGAWREVPHGVQVRLVVAGVTAAMGGLLIGLLMPRRSAAACSALLGTAIWLPAFGWLLHATESPGREMLAQPALIWLILWLTLAALGFAIQVATIRRRRAAADE